MVNAYGYKMVGLFTGGRGSQKRQSVHSIVATHFVPGFEAGLQVDHIDQNKVNNLATNLRWVTSRQNHRNRTNQSPSGHNIEQREGGFKVHFLMGGKKVWLPLVHTLEEAVRIRDEFIRENDL